MSKSIDQFLNSKALLRVDSTGQDVQRDLQVSTAVLLMHMANIEGSFGREDVKAIAESLGRQFSLQAEEAGEIMEIADFLEKEKSEIGAFAKRINARFEKSQKITIMAMLWKVMLTDGLVTKLEAAFAAESAELLSLSTKDIDAAKELAEKGEA